jgi:hypothetical protein
MDVNFFMGLLALCACSGHALRKLLQSVNQNSRSGAVISSCLFTASAKGSCGVPVAKRNQQEAPKTKNYASEFRCKERRGYLSI